MTRGELIARMAEMDDAPRRIEMAKEIGRTLDEDAGHRDLLHQYEQAVIVDVACRAGVTLEPIVVKGGYTTLRVAAVKKAT